MPVDPDTGLENWDCPDSFDPIKMHNSLRYTRTHDGSLPKDHPTGEENNTHDGSLSVSQEFLNKLKAMIPNEIDQNSRFVITDGILLFWDPLIYKEFDSSIFIHASRATLKQRREARQGYVTQEGYWIDPPGYFDDLVWPQYVKWNAHLFPNGDAKGIDHEQIKDLVVMESDNSSIEQLATNAVKTIINTLHD
ncbi:hypothetical protein NQZ79_g800 [Umbelopsis isabellina]|nr:hypothetical protein NQZ79_g800 [Umbelopsis isabellina]